MPGDVSSRTTQLIVRDEGLPPSIQKLDLILKCFEYGFKAAAFLRIHWKAIVRNGLALATMAVSTFVVVERVNRGFEDVLWRSCWCFSMTGSCFLCLIWSQMSRKPDAFFFLAIILGFFFLNRLLDGSESLFDNILPALPLGVTSGSFLAYLYLKSPGYCQAVGLEAPGMNVQVAIKL